MAVSVSRFQICATSRYGGIGRHMGLKIPREQSHTGSSPVSGTTSSEQSALCSDAFLY